MQAYRHRFQNFELFLVKGSFKTKLIDTPQNLSLFKLDTLGVSDLLMKPRLLNETYKAKKKTTSTY